MQAAAAPDAGADAVRRGLRVHGALDLGFAALYGWLGFAVAPGRVHAWNLALGAVIALLSLSGALLLAGHRRARRVAQAAQLALLGVAAVAIAGLVASAAYLRGIYGPLGQGMALVSLLVAALVVELCALLPLFQLRFLARDDVRAHLERR